MNTLTLPRASRPLRASLFAMLAAAAALMLATGTPAHAAGPLTAHAEPARLAAEYAALRADTLAGLENEPAETALAGDLVTHAFTGELLVRAGHLPRVEARASLASAVVLPEREIVLAAPAARRLGPTRAPDAAAPR
ncbi:MAG: hypothetical protein JJT93_03345, partial [Gammaproteobacteria bacterium]|nr:hypothetical protein [Gammaproteobacteria bacterium]